MGKAVFWIFFFLIGLPMILTVFLQLFAGGVIAGMAWKVQNDIESSSYKPEEYKIPGVERILNTGSRYSQNRNFQSLAKFGEIEAPRQVEFSSIVRVRDLLKSGQKHPAKELEEVFLEAQAGFYAEEECKRLERKLASHCAVKHTAIRKMDDKHYRLTIHLGFVQKDKFGEVPEAEEVVFREVKTEKVKKVFFSSFNFDKQQDFRATAYSDLVTQCSKLRKKFGNCAISKIKFTMSGNSISRNSKKGRATAQFEMAYLRKS